MASWDASFREIRQIADGDTPAHDAYDDTPKVQWHLEKNHDKTSMRAKLAHAALLSLVACLGAHNLAEVRRCGFEAAQWPEKQSWNMESASRI